MQEYTLSVIVPCHNYGRFLSRCLQSILGQTRRPEEIIVVDDASSDDTKAVVERYQNAHRVRYVRVEYEDPNKTRQAGISESHGEIICCVDADDSLDPFYFEYGLEYFKKDQKIGIVYSDMQHTGLSSVRTNFPPDTYSADISVNNFIHSGALVRRDALEVANAFDHTGPPHRHEDWSVWRRVIEAGFVGIKQAGLYYYTKHEHSLSCERHIGYRGYTYFKSAALSEEQITLFTPLAGREDLWNKYAKFLERQTWPHDQLHLILMDTSQDPRFGETVRNWLARSDYRSYQYLAESVGSKGLADEARLESQEQESPLVLRDVRFAMARIYNWLRKFVFTNYLWILEDDVIPPLDVCEELMRCFCPDTVSVCAPYQHRFQSGYVAWGDDRELLQDGEGIQRIRGNGFGCVVLRTRIFQQVVFSHHANFPDCDSTFYELIADPTRIVKVNWSLKSAHLSPSFFDSVDEPKARETASGLQAPTQIIFTEHDFDESFYLTAYPDVRAGVLRGHFKSGFEHYQLHGRLEGRSARKAEKATERSQVL